MTWLRNISCNSTLIGAVSFSFFNITSLDDFEWLKYITTDNGGLDHVWSGSRIMTKTTIAVRTNETSFFLMMIAIDPASPYNFISYSEPILGFPYLCEWGKKFSYLILVMYHI